MPNGEEKKRVKSGAKPGLKIAEQEFQDMPVKSTVLQSGKEYAGTLYTGVKKLKPIAMADTITNFMDEGGPEQYLKGAYRPRKPVAQKLAVPVKKSSSVINAIASKYKR